MSTTEHHAILIPGDGIGPEVTEAATRVIEAAGVRIRWESMDAGSDVALSRGSALPDEVVDAVRRVGVALKGPIGTPIGGGFRSANVQLRQTLDLYACVRPIKTIKGLNSRYDDVDFVIVRENTEGMYSGLEHQVAPGVCESLKITTERASLRVARYAFEFAKNNGRSKVTAVHKANIMKLTDGLFLECVRRVANNYADIELEEMIVDNCAMQLVVKPEQFDVMVLPNFYGDVLSDLGAGLVGGLGVVPGSNIGERCAVFEAVHGSAPDIAGKRVANPSAVILSGAEMCRHLGERDAAAAIIRAVHATLADPAKRTGDIGGSATLDEITQSIIDQLS